MTRKITLCPVNGKIKISRVLIRIKLPHKRWSTLILDPSILMGVLKEKSSCQIARRIDSVPPENLKKTPCLTTPVKQISLWWPPWTSAFLNTTQTRTEAQSANAKEKIAPKASRSFRELQWKPTAWTKTKLAYSLLKNKYHLWPEESLFLSSIYKKTINSIMTLQMEREKMMVISSVRVRTIQARRRCIKRSRRQNSCLLMDRALMMRYVSALVVMIIKWPI